MLRGLDMKGFEFKSNRVARTTVPGSGCQSTQSKLQLSVGSTCGEILVVGICIAVAFTVSSILWVSVLVQCLCPDEQTLDQLCVRLAQESECRLHSAKSQLQLNPSLMQ